MKLRFDSAAVVTDSAAFSTAFLRLRSDPSWGWLLRQCIDFHISGDLSQATITKPIPWPVLTALAICLAQMSIDERNRCEEVDPADNIEWVCWFAGVPVFGRFGENGLDPAEQVDPLTSDIWNSYSGQKLGDIVDYKGQPAVVIRRQMTKRNKPISLTLADARWIDMTHPIDL